MSSDQPLVKVPTRPSSVRPLSLAAVREVTGGVVHGDARTTVRGMSLNTETVRRGDLFAALPGGRTHGATFAAAAARRGATAILTDAEGRGQLDGVDLPTVVVDGPRGLLGTAAAAIYGHPAEHLTLIGVTGTQGKTTATQLMGAGLAAAGRRGAVIGTMGTWIDRTPVMSPLTTPEAPDLHALFAVMVERRVDVCALEVSSHALVMGRVDGVVFDLAVFTNFGRDHLDFHDGVEEYFAAKAQLFTRARAERALVNADDEFGRRLLRQPEIETRTFSTTTGDADWSSTTLGADQAGSSFDVRGPGRLRLRMSVSMPGGFNVDNALCAIAALGELGIDVGAAAGGIAEVRAVPGRMERIEHGQPFGVVVDYAHKPDAVTAALEALRPVTEGELIIVIGAGGDRDQGKRPLMGEIASRLADVVVVTDDNPRSEDPAVIRAEIVAGTRPLRGRTRVLEIADRRTAITTALTSAGAGDTVLIAGKGHETGQESAGAMVPFDDREVAAQVLDQIVATKGSR